MKRNKVIGQFGENVAKNFLIRNAYKIIDQNIKTSYFEIDIIAKKNGLYVFVEVKTRTSDIYGEADSAMSARKIKNIKRGASRYILFKKIDENMVRFDFISVDINKIKKSAKIKHYKDII
jgi:putative endonuclease